MRNLYAEVTERIAHQLETGVVPWVKPWSQTPGSNVSCNAISNRPYSGCNAFLLWLIKSSHPNPRYLTFNQAKAAGGSVRRGEHGVPIYFVKHLFNKGDTLRDGTTATRPISMLRAYTVFNVDQCDGLPEKVIHGPGGAPEPIIPNADDRTPSIEAFITATKAHIRESEHSEAAYLAAHDAITMPSFSVFHSAAHYYATLFHELGHWTGHKDRLDRDLKNRFGTAAYAAEELIAELTSAFLCAEHNVDGDIRHAGYIASWIKLLREDNKAFFTAASAAQKAADFIRGVQPQAEKEAA